MSSQWLKQERRIQYCLTGILATCPSTLAHITSLWAAAAALAADGTAADAEAAQVELMSMPRTAADAGEAYGDALAADRSRNDHSHELMNR